TLVFEEPDERFFLSVAKTRSKRFVTITLASQVTSEAWFADAAAPGPAFRVIRPRVQDIEYYATHQGDRFLIWTNDTGRNFRLVEASPDDASNWSELVQHRDDVRIETVTGFADHVVRFERSGGLRRMHV